MWKSELMLSWFSKRVNAASRSAGASLGRPSGSRIGMWVATTSNANAHTAAETERLLREGGNGFSIARASVYIEFFARWLDEARRTGELRLPAADGRISLVSRLDVGRCLAALALSEPTGRHHEITGPASPDLPAVAALAGARYVALTPDEYAAETAAAGEDAWWLYAFSTMFASIRERRWAAVSEEAGRLMGRPPLAVADVVG